LKTAFISGITGQDGSYLAELLLDNDYFVVGLKRRTSLICTERLNHIYDHKNFRMEYWDLNDTGSTYRLLLKYKPTEFYNLAAQSHVRVSFDVPEDTISGIVLGTTRILEAIRHILPDCRFYQASSSEMFGENPNIPATGYTENSRLMPASPYACAKVFAHNLVRNYRASYGLHTNSGILFNHESPRRGETFVTKKITMAAANIRLGNQTHIELGNLTAKRDWGHAKDYVKAMYLMLQQDEPDDYVIATGKTYSVKEFLDEVWEQAKLGSPDQHLRINKKYFRPQEVPYLLGDSSKATNILGWTPHYDFTGLAKDMYDHDYNTIIGETR
jgi:GDPmannose 4,6-dehydratase|tara:strand:+ start:208 stop:1194 length:987 start_codon:yes stop_codon:yes gene_type:complete